MTFEPADGLASSVVLSTGTAGGERWELIARIGGRGALPVAPAGDSAPGSPGHRAGTKDRQLLVTCSGPGAGSDARAVFAALPADVVRVVALDAAAAARSTSTCSTSQTRSTPARTRSSTRCRPTGSSPSRPPTHAASWSPRATRSPGEPQDPGRRHLVPTVPPRVDRSPTPRDSRRVTRGLRAAAAERLDPGLAGGQGIGWTDGTLQEGEVSIRGVTAGSLVAGLRDRQWTHLLHRGERRSDRRRRTSLRSGARGEHERVPRRVVALATGSRRGRSRRRCDPRTRRAGRRR